MNVLIVDDSATIRNRLREMLSILPGVDRVDTAATASDARQCIEAALPDVVILDLHLSAGSGIEVLDALRPTRDRVTVIVLTNDPTSQGRAASQRAGADFFFDKSAEFQRSVDIIAGLARSRTAPRDQLLISEEALRASEARYRELFDNATDAIFTTDLDLNVTAFNRAAEALTGYTREQANGLNIASIVGPETLEQAQRKLTDQWGGKAPSVFETEILARDGRRVPIEVIAGLVSREGQPIGIQGIARDISDRKRLEQELLQAHKMEAVGRLAGGIAHDFNNLLTVIVGYSQDIIERLPPDDPTHADAVQIFNAGGYAVDLTRQLLAFSRRQILAPKVLDLSAVIGQLAAILRRLIGADVELVIRAAQDRSAVKADPGQLEQVIVNLVVNAADAMPHGGTLTVETSTAVLDASAAAEWPGLVQGHYVSLTISDTGTGMDALTKAQVFEPFFTTKEAGKGTGLGLCTVYGIVKQSGGYIFVESEPGKGTTFRLYFPRRPAGEIEPPPTVPALCRVEGGAESILLVDDDGGVRAFVERVLAARGYAVLSASSTIEALQLCDGHPGDIDLLLTDVVMPGMTGPALAEAVRARYPGIKVVYTSGYATDGIDQRVLDPLVAFIAKPFTARDLVSQIREALDGRKPPS